MIPNEKVQNTLLNLPKSPGVYQFYDDQGKLLYVGKAKSLKNRVSSYFNNSHLPNAKTAVLVRKIVSIQYILVDTEFDALLLENALIKEHQPRFNIQLRDDKTYPWICIKKERFPRVFPTRTLVKDGSEYFGPYASVKMMNTLLEFVRQSYKVRTCSLPLTPETINEGKYKVCLEYHIGNCKAPCVNKQTEEEYNESIDEITQIIKGNINQVIRTLKEEMAKLAEALEFEKAQQLKVKVDMLERYQGKSTIVNTDIHNVDVFSLVREGDYAYINFMKIMNGSVIQSHTLELKTRIEEADEALLLLGIAEMRSRFESTSKEIYLPFEIETEIPGCTKVYPKIGDKKKLIDFSLRNATYYMNDRKKEIEKIDPERSVNRILDQLQKDLNLKVLPRHIECFDNSNFQGDFAVAACVVFKNAKPSKADYRHFNIKTVEGPNDFASMEEIVYRRYKRLLDEEKPLPQLIIIDGGKGQLSSALVSLDKLGLRGKIAIIGIAKKLEEIYFPGDNLPLYIDKRSESLKLIQSLRNEAHRFGITHHRNKRSKGTIKSELSEIKGVGPKLEEKLLKEFKSVKRIKESSEAELKAVVGEKTTQILIEYFANQKLIESNQHKA